MATRKSDVATLYKGSPGQWSWLLHRITGVAVILFLFAHVVDTAVVGWGPEAYNRVVSVYHNWVDKLLELGLVAAVLYHAINGVKIMVFDFWPSSARHMKGIALPRDQRRKIFVCRFRAVDRPPHERDRARFHHHLRAQHDPDHDHHGQRDPGLRGGLLMSVEAPERPTPSPRGGAAGLPGRERPRGCS